MDAKVYVGDLGFGAAKQELEEIFGRYGPLKNVWVARNPPGFAFVEFEDPRDAEDSVKELDGTRMNNRRVRVEMSTGKSRSRRGSPRYGGSSYGRSSYYSGRRRSRSFSPRSPRRRRSSYSRSRSRSFSPRRDRRRSSSSDRR